MSPIALVCQRMLTETGHGMRRSFTSLSPSLSLPVKTGVPLKSVVSGSTVCV
jgi:hypothetical protein